MNPTINTPALESGVEYKRRANVVKAIIPAFLVYSWFAGRWTTRARSSRNASFEKFSVHHSLMLN
jgi:hypothetical protein